MRYSCNSLLGIFEVLGFRDVFDFYKLEFSRPMASLEEFVHPVIFLWVSNTASDFVTGVNELVDDMATDEAISPCHQNI